MCDAGTSSYEFIDIFYDCSRVTSNVAGRIGSDQADVTRPVRFRKPPDPTRPHPTHDFEDLLNPVRGLGHDP